MSHGSPWRLALGAASAYLLVTAAAGIYLAEGVIRPPRAVATQADRAAAERLAAARAAHLEARVIVARDGAHLRAWLFTPSAWNGRAVLVLHGQGSNRAGMLPYIELFLTAGFQLLAPDARAQGDSDGDFASYGVLESGDVRAWASYLKAAGGGICVYGFAESMGAGTLLQALEGGEFCAVVAEAPFASFREVAYDRIGSVLHVGAGLARTFLRPIVESGLLYLRVRYGVDLDRADPLTAMPRSKVPVLLVHGKADTSIPVRHSRLLAAARPEDTDIWEVPGAGHCAAMGIAPAEFAQRVEWRFGVGPRVSEDASGRPHPH